MIHNIFSIFDQKAKAYLPPFILPEIGQAVRAFGDCINSETHQFHAHPHDYTLMNLGQFDDQTGRIIAFDPIMTIGNGNEYTIETQKREPVYGDLEDETEISDEASVQPDP